MNLNSRWSRWNNYPYLENISENNGNNGGQTIKNVNIEITGGNGLPSGTGYISDGTLNITLNNIKGDTGNDGNNGSPGVNGLSIELKKSENSITYNYTGERILQTSFSKNNNSSPTIIRTFDFTKMKNIIINDIPSEVKNVRIKFISFIAVDEQGKKVGSSNPSYMPGIVSPGSFSHLGTLDPSNGTKYNVSSKKCVIEPEFNTKIACTKELEDINKAIYDTGKTASRIESIIYCFQYLNTEEEVVGENLIKEVFSTYATDKSMNIVDLSELKGDNGKVDEDSVFELFKKYGYKGEDKIELMNKLVSLINE